MNKKIALGLFMVVAFTATATSATDTNTVNFEDSNAYINGSYALNDFNSMNFSNKHYFGESGDIGPIKDRRHRNNSLNTYAQGWTNATGSSIEYRPRLGDLRQIKFSYMFPQRTLYNNTSTDTKIRFYSRDGTKTAEIEFFESGDAFYRIYVTTFNADGTQRDTTTIENGCSVLCPADYYGGTNTIDYPEGYIYDIYVNQNSSFNIAHSEGNNTWENVSLSMHENNSDIHYIKFHNGGSNSLGVDNIEVNGYWTDIKSDFAVTIPLPKVVDDLGLPFGSLLLFNLVLGFLGLLIALVPDELFNAYDSFTDYVGGVITTATTSLEIAAQYMAWIQEVGLKRLKELLAVAGLLVGVRYAGVFKEALDGGKSIDEAFMFVINDVLDKVTSIERIIYRAMDTLTNITHLAFYLFETVVKIYRTVKNHIPLIG